MRTLSVLSCQLSVLLLAAPAVAHEWYSGLTDQRGLGCCDVRDCAEVADGDWRYVNGALEIRVGRDWWPVPDTAWVGVEPPDGRPHACKLASESFIRCVIWPGQM